MFVGGRSAAKRAFLGSETPVNDLTQLEEAEAASKALAEAKELKKLDFWMSLTGDGWNLFLEADRDTQWKFFEILSVNIPSVLFPLPDLLTKVKRFLLFIYLIV